VTMKPAFTEHNHYFSESQELCKHFEQYCIFCKFSAMQ